MFNVKRTLASAAVAVALSVSGFANAGTASVNGIDILDDGTAGDAYELGTLTLAPTALFVTVASAPFGGGGSYFEEYAEFSAPALSGGAAVANTYVLTFNGTNLLEITGLTVELWEGAPHPSSGSLITTFSGNNTTASFSLLAGGDYHFDIGGYFGPDAVGGQYSLTVGLVPEPETYAMLLAGLGLMGFVARRRQRKLAAA